MKIKNLYKKGIVQLSYIIHDIMKNQHCPTEWKKEVIISILKFGKNF